MSLFSDKQWKVSYNTDTGNPVKDFYEPALSCAVLYDRITGYFSAKTLSLAARGMKSFLNNGGKMRLVVSVQLEEDDAKAIKKGYDLRKRVDERLNEVTFENLDFWTKDSLEVLSKMVAEERLEVKVGVLKSETGEIVTGSILHDKVGILTDSAGNQISFIGSNNETGSGWSYNSESFEVACSWLEGSDPERVKDKKEQFNRIWDGRSKRMFVLPFPVAVLKKLLVFQHSFETENTLLEEPIHIQTVDALTHKQTTMQEMWSYLKKVPKTPEGITVGIETAPIKPWNHQIRNFVRAIQKDPVRLLIADEVGLGKTISAGMILRQMVISGRANRVLLLAPGGVLVQWQNELYEKFNLYVPIYNGFELVYRKTHSLPEKRVPIQRKQLSEQPILLMSTFLARRQDRMNDLIESTGWDFIMVDEVHHARRKAAGTASEGSANLLLRLLRSLVQNQKVKSILFLSATPMQVHPIELWDILSLLGLPEEWTEENYLKYYETLNKNLDSNDLLFLKKMFCAYEEKYGSVNLEDWISKLEKTTNNRITCVKILKSLRDRANIVLNKLSFKEREILKYALSEFNPIKTLIARNTRNLLKEYYRKGILKERIPNRIVQDIPLDMPPSEKAFYEEVENYIQEIYNKGANRNKGNTGFILTIYRRRLASSYHALYQTLSKRLRQLLGNDDTNLLSDEDIEDEEIAGYEEDFSVPSPFPAIFLEEKARINQMLKMISKLGTPYKFTRLIEEIRKQKLEGKTGGIIFTQFTDTLHFLREHLIGYFPESIIGCYSGEGAEVWESNRCSRITKEELKEKFKKGSIQYLICTDAAAEGLNLQFAGLLINYDLPWNPMKVEQRIGRIDRIGQKHENIHIVNFAYKGTVEAEIYFRLANRIQLFQGIIGKLQPILTVLKTELDKLFLLEGEERKEMMDRLMTQLEESSIHLDSSKDIDRFTEDHSEFPQLPSSLINMETIKDAFKLEEYRPKEIGWKPIDEVSYSLNYPGLFQSLRVTMNPDIFEIDPLNHEFLSYGNWMFDRLLEQYG